MTNTNEGVHFVNQTAPANATFYAGQLFPNFGVEQDRETGELYAGVGDPLNQVNRIQGECKATLLYSHFILGESFYSSYLHLPDVFPSQRFS